ncbi:MAG TPA: RluA family pseudouridine synthase [bacterium]|nr:RluA family pseudouridine synthase [bacterium]
MDIKQRIMHEDDNIVVINKPAGVPTVPGRNLVDPSNIYGALKKIYGTIFIVHRLDKDTSGVIIFAKDAATHRAISMMFDRGEVKKMYVSILMGRTEKKSGVIDLPLAPLRKKSGVMTVDEKSGKKAVTRYKVEENFGNCFFAGVFPETGKTHQIRVHFAAIGHPVVGDRVYDRIEAVGEAKRASYEKMKAEGAPAAVKRMLLHSAVVSFRHPGTRKEESFRAPLPDDFKLTLELLRVKKRFAGERKPLKPAVRLLKKKGKE